MNRRELSQAAELGRGDVQPRTELLFYGRTVNDRRRRALRMIVSYRDAGISMVSFGMMMIGIILMSQTVFECLSRSCINKEKRKQANSDFSHGINLTPLRHEAARGYRR